MYLKIILLLLHFTPTIVASVKYRKRPVLKNLLPLPAPFQNFRFRVRSASTLFHQSASASSKKFTAYTASASTSLQSSHTYAEHVFGFCLQVFPQAWPQQWVN